MRALLILAVVMGLSACRSGSDDGGESEERAPTPAEQGGGGGAEGGGASAAPFAKPNPQAIANPGAAAELLDIQLASLRQEIPEGNFATLTVVGETGAPVPLSIESVEVAVTIEGHMARTEVTQVFRNHQPRQTEGTYEFTLPDGAAISRLAMDVEGKMMEGELVERERARAIYEEIVRSMRDPALLEWQGGNRFKTQIFPIPPSGTKTVVLAYETLLPESRDGSRYVYSLPKLTGEGDAKTLGRFHFTMTTDHDGRISTEGYPVEQRVDGTRTKLELDQPGFVPQGPLTVRFEGDAAAKGTRAPSIRFAQRTSAVAATAAEAQGQQAPPERFFSVDLVPAVEAPAESQARSLVIALDTSAGLGQPVVDQARLAALMLLSQLPEGTPWRVVYGDYKPTACGDAAMKGTDMAVDCLKGLDAGGATDLDALLATAIEAAGSLEGPTAIVLFSDGAASLGQLDGDVIRGRAERAIAARQGVTLHTVAIGHGPSESDLEKLAMIGSGHALRLTPVGGTDAFVNELFARIQEPVLTDVTVEVVDGTVEGLSPSRPRNLARGQGLVVLGKLVSQKAVLELKGKYAGQAVSQRIELTPDGGAMVDSPMLANFWARGTIDTMHQRGEDTAAIVDFSLDYGVMSPYTSFLVLENEAAYERFAVERRKEAERLAREQQELANSAKDKDDDDRGVAEQKNLKKSDEDLKVVLEKPAAPPTPTTTATADAPQAAAPAEEAEMEPSPADDFGSMGGEGGPGGGGDNSGVPKSKSESRRSRDEAPKRRPKPTTGESWDGEKGSGGRHWNEEPGIVAQPWDPTARIKELEARRETLSVHEVAELAWLLGDAGRKDDGSKLLETWLAGQGQKSAGERFEVFAARPGIATTYAEIARPLAAEALKAGPLHEALATTVVINAALEAQDVPAAVRAALDVGRPLDVPALTTALQILTSRGQTELARALVDELHKSRGAAFVLTLLSDWNLQQQFADRRVLVLQELVGGQPPRLDLVDTLIGAIPASDAGLKKGTVGLVTDVCSRGATTLPNCERWLHALSPDGGVEAVLAEVRAARLKNIDTIRALDVGNPDLIAEFATALRTQGRNAEADRLLSEIVEFSPHAYDARVKYVAALRQLGRPLDVCNEYAVAVQLNPAMRDHFRHMMSLRRDFGEDLLAPADLRECIVQGVSNLPVNRAVSLVLTWEDPTADIDLHIHEVGEHHVYYQRRESPNGGLLYYDITDGFGPEIYVLGTGPKGTYKLSLVYYARGSGKVRGTLTVLENAGSRGETRKDIPFELTGPDNKIEVPIYELNL